MARSTLLISAQIPLYQSAHSAQIDRPRSNFMTAINTPLTIFGQFTLM